MTRAASHARRPGIYRPAPLAADSAVGGRQPGGLAPTARPRIAPTHCHQLAWTAGGGGAESGAACGGGARFSSRSRCAMGARGRKAASMCATNSSHVTEPDPSVSKRRNTSISAGRSSPNNAASSACVRRRSGGPADEGRVRPDAPREPRSSARSRAGGRRARARAHLVLIERGDELGRCARARVGALAVELPVERDARVEAEVGRALEQGRLELRPRDAAVRVGVERREQVCLQPVELGQGDAELEQLDRLELVQVEEARPVHVELVKVGAQRLDDLRRRRPARRGIGATARRARGWAGRGSAAAARARSGRDVRARARGGSVASPRAP